jgi:hypothetical protein
MRNVPIGCLFACSLAGAGCLGQGGNVMLTISQAMNVSPAVTTYTAGNATANSDEIGVIHFTATSSGGELTMLIQGPLKQGDMVDLTVEHNQLSYDQLGAGWGSNGGMIAVDGIAPYNLRFVTVPMLPGSGAAKGNFVFNGLGTFE